MSEVKKKIIINHEHLNPNSQKRNNGSSSRGKTLKKMPGFVRPSELKNNLIKLLKQKREEKQQDEKQQQQEKQQQEKQQQQHEKQQQRSGTPSIVTNDKLFDKKKYENIFSKDFDESLNYLKC